MEGCGSNRQSIDSQLLSTNTLNINSISKEMFWRVIN